MLNVFNFIVSFLEINHLDGHHLVGPIFNPGQVGWVKETDRRLASSLLMRTGKREVKWKLKKISGSSQDANPGPSEF